MRRASGIHKVTNDYRVARSSKLRTSMRGMPSGGASADWEFRNDADYYRIMGMARYVDQNDKLVGQAVTRAVNLTFKSGLKYDAATGDDKLDDDLKARWNAWSEDPLQCDAKGRSCLDDLAKLAYRHVVVDGDHIVLPLDNRTLQLIEGHRLVTPKNAIGRKASVHCGVRRDSVGRAIEYWMTREDQGVFGNVQKVEDIYKYPAFDTAGNPQVLHLFKPDRISQTRGVSSFVRIIDNAMAHDDLQWAMLIKEQAAACLTFFREREGGTGGVPVGGAAGGAAAFGGITNEINFDGTARTFHDIAPGMEIEGRPGEKLHAFAPNLPGDGFLKHSVQVLTFISVNLGIPVMVLLLDPSMTNFSGWRGAMDIAQHGFNDTRAWMTTQFYTPVYRWWLRSEIRRDPALRAALKRGDVNLFGHQFTAPYDPYIDPAKDVIAEEKMLLSRLDSRRNVLARRGLDLDEVDADIVADQVLLIERCLKAAAVLSTSYPDAGITWRDVYEVGGTQGSPPAQPAPDEPKGDAPDA